VPTSICTLSLHDALPISITWVVIWMSPVGASGLTRGCSSRGPVSSQAISSANICQRGTDREQFPAAENPGFVPSPPSPSLNPHRSEEHTSELQSRFDLVC